jgi:PAS domain S-box-containing protein
MASKRTSLSENIQPKVDTPETVPKSGDGFLAGGGEMVRRTREYDWARTPVGPIDSWPDSLRSAVSLMLNSSFPIFIWWGKDEMLNFYNDAYIPILGGRHPAALGASAPDLWPEIIDDLNPLVDAVFSKGESVYKKNQRLVLNRSSPEEEAYFTFSYSPLFDDVGTVTGLFCAVFETTDEVLSLQKLEESEARFRNLADTAPMYIAMADESGDAVYFNKPWLEFTGKKMDEMRGLGWLSVLHPEDAPKFESDFKEAFSKQIPIKKEYRFRRADGEYRWMLAIGAPRFTPDGHFSGYFGTYTDFHELKQAQLAVEEREERFRTLIELSPAAVQLVSAEGKILYSSESVKNVLGYTPEELANEGVGPYLHPDDREYFAAKLQELLEHPDKAITLQYRVKHKDGTWAWLETVGANHLDTPNINALLGNFRNITEQKKAQARIEQSEGRFRALADNIPNLAWMAHADGSIFWYNDRWYDYTGTTLEEMEGWGWRSVHDPHYLPIVLKKWKASIKSGRDFEMVFPIRGADNVFRPFLTRVVALRSKEGTIEQWIGTNTDISEQLKVEQTEARNQELIALNKAKDEFISLASHQLRTPATGVKQYIGMLLEGYAGALSETQRTFAERANDSNERELTIINDLLNVAQIDAGKMQIKKRNVDLVAFANAIIDEQRSKFEERQQSISLICSRPAVTARVDEGRMRMVLENLIDNASKYTPADKKITVTIRKPSEKTVSIDVKDQGVGIEATDCEKIFDKFVRIDNSLSDTINGSGIGLYLVKEVVSLHDGTVSVASKPNQGTTFTITLPV